MMRSGERFQRSRNDSREALHSIPVLALRNLSKVQRLTLQPGPLQALTWETSPGLIKSVQLRQKRLTLSYAETASVP